MIRREDIEDLAEVLSRDFCKDDRVNPANIAQANGLTFNYGSYGSYFDGLLECRARRFHVYINVDSYRGPESSRARFSFAHELGHYFLDWHRCALERGAPIHGSKADFQSNCEIEREADLFAANLLLPKARLQKLVSRNLDADKLLRIAARFSTSLSATAIRCARLNLAPMIVMRWTRSGRAWCWSSEEFERQTGNKAYKSLSRIPQDSPTRLTLDGGRTVEGKTIRKGTTLSTWFPSICQGWSSDAVVIEECLSLGSYGALTLLRPDGPRL